MTASHLGRGRSVARLVGVGALLLAVLVSIVGPAAPAQALSPDLVISQVYGGGGNTGAPYTHDFVELFNRSSSPASLAGLSIQYASATGTGNLGANSGQLTELPNVTLQPGQYYLVQQASTAAVGATLPSPDLSDATPINMSGTAGKVALVSGTASLGCNGGSNPCNAGQQALIIDLVGYGGANFFEGSAAPTLSNTTAAVRAGAGCVETDNNSADFAASAPAPRNTASPLAPCGGPPPPPPDAPLAAVCPASLTTVFGTAASASLQASDADDAVTGATLAVTPAAAGITLGAVAPGNNVTVALNVAADVPVGSYSAAVTFTNADGATAGCTVAVTVQNDLTPIGTIQGSVDDTANGDTFRSSLAPASGNGAGQTVRVQGVIYQRVLSRASNGNLQYGFFIQNTAATADADPNSSDGIFVFMGTFTSLIGGYVPTVGDEVVISGRVSEFFNFTQLSSASLVRLVRSGVNVDAEVPAFEVAPPDDNATSRRYWERREGMRARVPAGSVTVDGRDVFPGTADAEIWLMRGDHPVAQRANPYERRVFRDFHPLDNLGALGSFDDGNGYRFMIASYGVKATSGDSFTLLPPARTFETLVNAPAGGVYYTFNKFAVMVDQQPEFTPGADPAANDAPQPFNRAREYSVAPYNVENLYDYRDDPFDGCDFATNSGCPGVRPPFDYVPASAAAYDARLTDFADQIIADLHAPDILMIAEAEDQDICAVVGGALDCAGPNNRDGKPDTLQELALRIAQRGGPAYDAAFDRDGSDDRGIISGFLYRTDRVALAPAEAASPILGSSPTVSYRGAALPYNVDVQNPKAFNAALPADVDRSTGTDGSNVFTRDPQVGLFHIYGSAVGVGEPVTVWALANHFSSTPDARAGQRREQAAYNAAIAAAIEAAYPGALVAVGGDLNVYPRPDEPFPAPDTRTPKDQLGPLYDQGLRNLFDVVLEENPSAAYGYVFQGQTQTIDHIFTSPSLYTRLVEVREAHVNADFAADYDGDGPRGLSDHDPQVARFLLDDTAPVTTASVSGTTNPLCPSDCFQGSATITLSAADSQAGVAKTEYRVNGGALQLYSGPFAVTVEGINLVEFFSTDAAGNVEGVKSIVVKVTTFPSTGVLDSFNRPDGRLGSSWAGGTNTFRIVGGVARAQRQGPTYWRASFGADQEAFVRLASIPAGAQRQGLLLKVQSTSDASGDPDYDRDRGAIAVSYSAAGAVVVETYRPGLARTVVATIPVTLAPGDLLGARALADGTVQVYVNCQLVGSADAGAFFAGKGGAIGLMSLSADGATFDDFGGGNAQ